MSSTTTWIRRDAQVAWRRVGEEIVILDSADARYHALNPTGSCLWERLGDPASEAELRDAVVAEFDVDRATAEQDIEQFLASMRCLKLVIEGP